jgi:hypothetical protein
MSDGWSMSALAGFADLGRTSLARKRHMHRSKRHHYSMTSSARASSVGENIEAYCLGRDHQCQR